MRDSASALHEVDHDLRELLAATLLEEVIATSSGDSS